MLITVFGKRGSGKTTIIGGNLNDFPGPVVVLDILGNFDDEDKYDIAYDDVSALEKIENYAIAENSDEKNENKKIIVVMSSNPEQTVEFMSSGLWSVAETHGIGGTLVLDEVDSISYSKGSAFDQLVRYGRNKDIHIVTGCRRPAELSRNVTAGANKMYLFRTQEPRDIEYFKSTVLDQRAEILQKLPQFHGILVDYDREEMCLFKIDIDGKIFILKTEPLNQTTKTTVANNQNSESNQALEKKEEKGNL